MREIFMIALIVGMAGVSTGASPSGADAARITAEHGLAGGLAVLVGSTDGAFECTLATSGTWVVQGLAFSAQARDASRTEIMNRGLYGAASVDWIAALPKLPYARGLITFLAIDRDAGAQIPSQSELLRCVSPLGVLAEKTGGVWKTTKKPRPAGHGNWTHWWADESGDGAGDDDFGGVPNAMRWIASNEKIPGMRTESRTGFRVDGNRLSYSYDTWVKNASHWLVGRDAYNGILLWERSDFGTERKPYIQTGGKIYTFMKRNAPMDVLDPSNGKTVGSLSGGISFNMDNWGSNGIDGEMIRSVIYKGIAYQCKMDTLVAVDIQNGTRKWRHIESSASIWNPTVDPKTGRVFAIVATGRMKWDSYRWPTITGVKSVVCFDGASGTEIWRRTVTPGSGELSQLAVANDKLVVYKSQGILGGTKKFYHLEALRVSDGSSLWAQPAGSTHMAVWNNAVCVWTGSFYSLADGKQVASISLGQNSRCNRFTASSNRLVGGLVTYFGKDFSHQRSTIARSQCATGTVVANNLTYFTPAGCGCLQNAVHGYQALETESGIDTVADSDRLQSAKDYAQGTVPGTQSFGLKGPVVVDWTKTNFAFDSAETTTPLTVGDKTFTAYVHQHRLEARQNGALAWSFVAGGRISSPPVVSGGKVHFGSVDGWLYTLDQSTGKLLWRFLAAPGFRRVVAYSQLESAWPVYGAILADGALYFSAGRHAELDGGIRVYAVDPSSGAIRWRTRFSDRHLVYGATQKAPYDVNSYKTVRNNVLRYENGLLVLPGASIDPKNPAVAVAARRAQVNSAKSGLRIWRAGSNTVNLHLGAEGEFTLRLLDAAGRTILLRNLKGPVQEGIALPRQASGLVIAEVAGHDGRTYRALSGR